MSEAVQLAPGVRIFLRNRLDAPAFAGLLHFLEAFKRILPHTELTSWRRDAGATERAVTWAGQERRRLNITVAIPLRNQNSVCLAATLQRRSVLPGKKYSRTLDLREKDICSSIVDVLAEFTTSIVNNPQDGAIEALKQAFDLTAVSRYIEARHNFSASKLFLALKKLSEQSYEGKAIPLGILVDTTQHPLTSGVGVNFEQCLDDKKFHVLTDGYDTAFLIGLNKTMLDIVDLGSFSEGSQGQGLRFFPEWSRAMALSCTDGRIGFSLTRQGDILYFENGTLRITYRAGKWQYWNHGHVLQILLVLSRAQNVHPTKRTPILRQIYRRALDLSFRRTGGLYVLLRNRKSLHNIVKPGDAIGDSERRSLDGILDTPFRNASILAVPSSVLVDIASLDGAIVIDNSGRLLAYGAVLSSDKTGGIGSGQGSRTKAAIGASHYGLATKVSSDGEIAFYSVGEAILAV